MVNPGAFNLDVYTEAYVQLKGAQGLQSYSDAYDSLTAAAVDELEAVGEKPLSADMRRCVLMEKKSWRMPAGRWKTESRNWRTPAGA